MTDGLVTDKGFSFLKLVPHVLRARGFRLYIHGKKQRQDSKVCRYLIDLWQNGGAAVLGHTPPNILRELKNAASRGLYAPFPHFTEGRFLKALSKLLPGCLFRIYAAPPQELAALYTTGKIKTWRPFVDPANPFAVPDFPLLELVLPVPFTLCVIAAKSEEQFAQLPPSDMLSPVLLAVAARGVHDLLASAQRGSPHLPRTFKALKAEGCPWQREGIYLNLKQKPTQSTWAALFKKFLEAGFLLPPAPEQPVILPGELSDGEDAKLAILLAAPNIF